MSVVYGDKYRVLRAVIEVWKSQWFFERGWEREHLHCGNSVSGYVQLGFFGASCRSSWVSVLFSTFFCLFSFWGKKKKICSIQLCCSVKSWVLLWMYECVSAPLLERQSPFVPTASHMLGHTAAPWPELHGTEEKGEQTLLVLLEALHHLSEQHAKTESNS